MYDPNPMSDAPVPTETLDPPGRDYNRLCAEYLEKPAIASANQEIVQVLASVKNGTENGHRV